MLVVKQDAWRRGVSVVDGVVLERVKAAEVCWALTFAFGAARLGLVAKSTVFLS